LEADIDVSELDKPLLNRRLFEEWLMQTEPSHDKTYPVDYSNYADQPDCLREQWIGFSVGIQALCEALASKSVADRKLDCFLYVNLVDGGSRVPPPKSRSEFLTLLELPPPSVMLARANATFFAYSGWLETVSPLSPDIAMADQDAVSRLEGVYISYRESLAVGEPLKRACVYGGQGTFHKFVEHCIGEHDRERQSVFLVADGYTE
jgi:hypothetical protein